MDGIPYLTRNTHTSYRADELTPALAQRMVDETEKTGNWLLALSTVLEELPPDEASYFERYVCSVRRSLALELVELDRSSIVLDHGCGWGAMTSMAAERAGGVVALDLVAHRARFTALRCQQSSSIPVLPIVAGDEPTLPFADEAFDLVIINGVLEWVPVVIEGDPSLAQLERLREIARVLKPGGNLLLAIENRYWWRYFLGKGEVHTGLPWVALLPRAFVRAMTRRQQRGEFRTYTYSLGGYLRMLRTAGFANVKRYLAFPDYNFPQEIVDLDDREAILNRYTSLPALRRSERVELALARCGLLPRLAYCYVFVAWKGNRLCHS